MKANNNNNNVKQSVNATIRRESKEVQKTAREACKTASAELQSPFAVIKQLKRQENFLEVCNFLGIARRDFDLETFGKYVYRGDDGAHLLVRWVPRRKNGEVINADQVVTEMDGVRYAIAPNTVSAFSKVLRELINDVKRERLATSAETQERAKKRAERAKKRAERDEKRAKLAKNFEIKGIVYALMSNGMDAGAAEQRAAELYQEQQSTTI